MKANEARQKAEFNYQKEVDRLAERTVSEIMPYIESAVEKGKFEVRLPWEVCQPFYDENVFNRTKELLDGYKLDYHQGNGLCDPHDSEPSYYYLEWK